MSEEKENQKKTKIKRRWLYLVIAIILISFLVVAVTTNLVVKWYVPEGEPTIVLTYPANHQTINNNTSYFTWTSNDPEGDPLTHVYYIDLMNTFNSPYKRAIDVGALTNYTPAVFMDGDWYWRVEVTDGSNINISSTWHVVFKNDSTNNFPSLSNGDCLPINGTTATTFVYTVNFTDPDNDTADYVRVYIDGATYNMTESDITDVNTTDGKQYSYSSTLGAGLHNFSFVCSDGSAINVTTTTENRPYVTEAPTTPETPGGGSGGAGSPDLMMNKITIQPRNTETYPGNNFEGNLIITDESYSSIYEVFWYIVLLDSDNNEISSNSGAMAIDTTVYAPYVVLTSENISTGTYRLLAKTYDMPREKLSASEIGMDTISVNIVKEPIASTIVDQVKSDEFLQYFLIVIAIILTILAVIWKRGVLLIAGIGITLLLMIVFNLTEFQYYSVIGIALVMIGCIFFTKLREKIPIPFHNLKILLGAMLIFIGFVLYFWQFV